MRNTTRARMSGVNRVGAAAVRLRQRWAMALLGWASLALGCASEAPGDEAIGTSVEAASLWTLLHVGEPYEYSLWDRGGNGRYTIGVCFTKATASGGAPRSERDWASDKLRAMEVLNATWHMAAPIDFEFPEGGDCSAHPDYPDIPDDWVPVELVYYSRKPDAWGGWPAGPGRGARGAPEACADECSDCTIECQVRYNYGENRYDFGKNLVHEVGHVLGIDDEILRPDFGVCYDKETGEPHYGDPRLDSAPLTAERDLESIYSLAECSPFRDFGDDNYALSYGDQLGISIVFPWSFDRSTGSMASNNGMSTASGVVIRADGSATPDWYAGGTHPDMLGQVVHWRRYTGSSYTQLPNGLTVSATSLASGSNDLWFSYTDYLGRTHTGRAPVIKDSELHTALVMRASVIL